MTRDEFEALLVAPESAHLEFKEARTRYEFDELVRYCVAIANEGGGQIVLGVSDTRPRRIVGTDCFIEPGKTTHAIYERAGLHVAFEEHLFEEGRVLRFVIPGRSPGEAWSERGTYWMRSGESLVHMTDERLRQIHAEAAPDFSAEVCRGATLDDLEPSSIEAFRQRWRRRDPSARADSWSDEKLLRNAELMRSGHVLNAALLLFGTREALGRLLPNAEIVFEYRSAEAAGPAQERIEFREGFLAYQDQIWGRVNQRNDAQSYQVGLFRTQVLTFDEAVIREAVLNAFCHRDYRRPESVFVRQYARRLEVSSPGGLPPGVTTENILDEQNPRNRRLAEALARCGLIERSGQGMNLMFEHAVRQSKDLPDFTGTSSHRVHLTLRGQVMNPRFLAFLERVGEETLGQFDTADLLVLDRLQREEPIPDPLARRLPRLLQIGVVESIGRGRGRSYLLSRRFAAAIGQLGTYTRRRGLDRQQNKELLYRHIRDNADSGSPMSELQQVVPALSRDQVNSLLDELRSDGRIRLEGQRRWSKWFPVL